MNRLLIILLFVTLCVCSALPSCKKSNGSGSFITATINGKPFSRGNCVFILDTGTFKSLQVFGADPNPAGGGGVNDFLFPFLKFLILDFNGPGTYSITNTFAGTTGGNPFPASPVTGAGVDSSDTNVIPGVYDTLVITAVSPNVVGTFSFSCTNSTRVVNGRFVAKPW